MKIKIQSLGATQFFETTGFKKNKSK